MKRAEGNLISILIFWQVILLSKGWYINIKGDIKLAGIFNVHMKGNEGKNYWNRCGKIEPQYGMMFVEAMLFAMDQVNKNSSFLYGLTLAARIHDTCGDRKYQRNAIVNIANYNTQGVIGPQYSDAAQTAATVFDIFGKSIISYSATSPDLEDRTKYPYFYRTVPSDRKVAKMLVNIALRLEWSYVAVVSSTGNYGARLSSLFREYANLQGICTPVDLQVAENAKPNDFTYILDRVKKHPTVKVVYLFLTDTHLRELFDSTESLKDKYGSLNFVVGDGLGSRVHIAKGKSLANGSLTIQVAQEEVPQFRDYFLNRRPEKNSRNIWFKQFWEDQFNCSIKNDSTRPRVCNGNEALTAGHGYYSSTPVLSVINAVYAYAHAFRKVIEQECIAKNKTAEYCFKRERLLQGLTSYKQLMLNIRNVRFNEPYRDKVFQFNDKGENREDYVILNWFMDANSNQQQFVQVGKWNTSNSGMTEVIASVNSYNSEPSPPETWRLQIDTSKIKWKHGKATLPISVCSKPCKFGAVKKLDSQKNKCCWTCVDCLDNDVIKNDTCVACSLDDIPDAARQRCKALPLRYSGLDTPLVSAVSCSTSIGLVSTMLVIALFLKNYNKRIVKASSRELCFNMLIGIAATYLAPIAFILIPSKTVCSLHRVVVGLSLTVSYAPLLLKTNRIYRIFRSAKTTVERPAMVSPRSQIFMSLALTAISVLIGLVSITGSESTIKRAYPHHRQYTLRFCELSNETVFMNLSFSTALMIATTWFAFKTRNFPKNYNEAKYIGFTMYTTCLVLAVFLPVFHLAQDKDGRHRIIIMCCICELIATINLVGLFGPRVKLMLGSNARLADANMTMNTSFAPAQTNLQRIAVTVDTWAPKVETAGPNA